MESQFRRWGHTYFEGEKNSNGRNQREVIRAKEEENLKKDKWSTELSAAKTQRRNIVCMDGEKGCETSYVSFLGTR